MSDALSCAELAASHVELLPARTVLSMLHQSALHPGDIEITGPQGDPGTQGADGRSSHSFNVLGMFGWPTADGTTSGSPATTSGNTS